jgi:adenylate kinase family enzyme
VFADATRPVVEFYRRRGILREVDGTGTPRQVFERVAESLAASV